MLKNNVAKTKKHSQALKGLRSVALFFIIFLIFVSPLQISSSSLLNVAQGYSGSVAVWWPTSNSVVSGVQPFKAVLNNMSVGSYNMFWQVEGGQWNWMSNNYTDYPHKEASVDVSTWNWKGTGPYVINFIATDFNSVIISQQSVTIFVSQPVSQPTSQVTQTTQTTTPSAPSSGISFYVNPNSQAKSWATANMQSDPSDATIMNKIANQPVAQWFGDWNQNIGSDVGNTVTAAASVGSLPVLVAYNIPHRDCGSYSAGGAINASAYKTWIQSFAQAIVSRKALVVLEPDALANMSCLSQSDQTERQGLMQYAVGVLKKQTNTSVYIDAGNPHWIDALTMASRLLSAGVAKADGFSLNISNFFTTQDNITYGKAVSVLISNKHFVIDTSRNGVGPTSDYQWCNPAGRALGAVSTSITGNPLVDAYLWIKNPTESDGNCNGGPAAGSFWSSYPLSLAKTAGW